MDDYMDKVRAGILKDLVAKGDSKLAKAVMDNNYFLTKITFQKPRQMPDNSITMVEESHYIIDCDTPFIPDQGLHVQHSKDLFNYFQGIEQWVKE